MMMTMVLVFSNCDGQYVYDDDGDDDDDLKVVVVVVATVRGEGFALLLVLLLLRGFSVVGCFTVACWEKIYLSMLFLLFLATTAAYMDTRLKREMQSKNILFLPPVVETAEVAGQLGIVGHIAEGSGTKLGWNEGERLN